MAAVSPTPDFSTFSPLLAVVAAQGEIKRYRRGVILMQEGEPGGSLYFVLSGLLRAYAHRARDDGREFTFSFSGPGETVGELSLDGGLRSANVAVESAALCSFVTRATLLRHVEREPALALELIGLVARRARLATSQAKELALDKAYDRLVRLLRAGAQPEPGGTACMVYPLTQQQLADQIGCRHSMVNKLLSDLVKGEYLRREQRPQGRVWVIRKALPSGW
jgi:CRP/FNR family transcriptional regulator, cyclic AMP receptor protein